MLASHMLANPVVIDNLYVLDELQTTTQVGGGLTLGGTDPTPLTVLTGASIANICTMPLLECLGNLHVAGTLNASVTDIILAPSMEVSGAVTCAALSTHRFSVDIYVAPEGNDGSGNGTITNPFATVQRALTQVEVTQGFGPKTIHLAPGTYAGDIIINSCVSIVSQTPDCAACVGTTISGSVIVAIVRGTDDVDSNIVQFDGIHFVTTGFEVSVAAFPILCTYVFVNCFLELDAAASTGVQINPVSGSKLVVQNSHFLNDSAVDIANLVFITCTIDAHDSLFEVRLPGTLPFASNGASVVQFASIEAVFARVSIRMHFDTVTFPDSSGTVLAGAIGRSVRELVFQQCEFQFTTTNEPVGSSFPYVIGFTCPLGTSSVRFAQCTFNLQFLDGYAANVIFSTIVYTTENNVVLPGGLSIIDGSVVTLIPF